MSARRASSKTGCANTSILRPSPKRCRRWSPTSTTSTTSSPSRRSTPSPSKTTSSKNISRSTISCSKTTRRTRISRSPSPRPIPPSPYRASWSRGTSISARTWEACASATCSRSSTWPSACAFARRRSHPSQKALPQLPHPPLPGALRAQDLARRVRRAGQGCDALFGERRGRRRPPAARKDGGLRRGGGVRARARLPQQARDALQDLPQAHHGAAARHQRRRRRLRQQQDVLGGQRAHHPPRHHAGGAHLRGGKRLRRRRGAHLLHLPILRRPRDPRRAHRARFLRRASVRRFFPLDVQQVRLRRFAKAGACAAACSRWRKRTRQTTSKSPSTRSATRRT